MIEEVLRLVRMLVGNPGSNIELGALIVSGIVACVAVIDKLTRAFKFPLTGGHRAAGLVLVGTLLSISTVAAANVFILPCVKTDALHPLVAVLAGLLVFLAVIAPMACFLFKSSYFKSLSVLILGMAAAAVVSALLSAGLEAVKTGGKSFDKTRGRTEKVNGIL